MGSRNPQEGDGTVTIIVLSLVWALGMLCGAASVLLIQAGIIAK